jgi:hypothetical protein
MLHSHTDDTIAGTIGGTLIAILALPFTTIASTVILGIIGATASFLTSMLLKYLVERYKNRKK